MLPASNTVLCDGFGDALVGVCKPHTPGTKCCSESVNNSARQRLIHNHFNVYHSNSVAENIIRECVAAVRVVRSEDVRTLSPVFVPVVASKQPVVLAGVNVDATLEPPEEQPRSEEF